MTEPMDDERPAGIRKSAAYSPELESLRGWAMLLVFVFHAESLVSNADRVGTQVSPWMGFVTAGHTGVTLFFVLSAYLLSRPFLEAGRSGHAVHPTDFFRRRVLRIMPLYTVAVFTAVVLCFDKPGAVTSGLRSLFFVDSIAGDTVLNHTLMPYSAVWWSLGTEAQFYLALPALGLCLRSRSGRIVGGLVLVAWAVFYGVATADRSWMMSEAGLRFSLGLPGRAPAFLSGILVAWIVSRHGDAIRAALRRPVWLRHAGADGLLVAVLLTLGFFLRHVTFLGFLTAERRWPIWHLAESVSWGLVLLLVLLAPIHARPLVSNRVLATLGLLSYSFYLVHVPIILGVCAFLGEHGVAYRSSPGALVATIVGIFAICTSLSALTYRFIERPFLVRKARIDR
jgi:peptidoglycan/LPS O-acetylase OafA/YrhL